MTSVDEEWASFLKTANVDAASVDDATEHAPQPSSLYISTKTKIVYLEKPIDIHALFWAIPIHPYGTRAECIIKKQIKIISSTREALNDMLTKLSASENYIDQHIITSIDNPGGRIAFKDVRKISIGLSKRDLQNMNSKKKSAFYNCCVLIFRMQSVDGIFKEYHAKIFNTGKLEMLGVQDDNTFNAALDMLLCAIQPYVDEPIVCDKTKTETVLVNSNFKCGFFINREALYDILKYKYSLHAIYDPCSYPGIQCKFYHDGNVLLVQSGVHQTAENVEEISFMIFRTGSVLIVGKCDEDVLYQVYDFLKELLIREYSNICQRSAIAHAPPVTVKKSRRKAFTIDTKL
jgi:hypothetical protein